MLRWALAAAAVVLIAAPATASGSLTRPEAALLAQMNAARTEHGLRPLRYDGRLEQAARAHSREMLATNTFAHGAFRTRMLQFDVAGTFAGENLAWGTGARAAPLGIVVAWLASPEHRVNLLRPSFRRVGIGSIVGTFLGYRGARVVTADFAG